MVLTNEQKVMNYINSNPNDVLVFGGNPLTFSIEPELPKLDNVYDLVHEVIARANEFNSTNGSGFIETSSGRRRSSIDIWRHIKGVLPEVTIFDVMRALYQYCIVDLKCGFFFCGGVRRNVFKNYGRYSKEAGNLNTEKSRLDEYGIHIGDWEKIGLDKSKFPVEVPVESFSSFGEWNPYYNPEKCGLKIIFSEDTAGEYEFDITLIVQELSTGRYFLGKDSGCSCPTPFEDFHSLSDFREIDEHEVRRIKGG